MPKIGGVEATSNIKLTNPEVKILILTAHANKSLHIKSLDMEPLDICLKNRWYQI